MEDRKKQILETIIKEHIKTAAPVGSGVLVEKYKLNISPATVRNEMAELESEGYIAQPHTSAGRIPTEKAYRLYLEKINANKDKIIAKNDNKEIDELSGLINDRNENSIKEAAKLLSGITGGAVFWAFHRHNIYYTGISQLFQQPEFSQADMIYDISTIIDRIDEIINHIYNEIKMGEQVLIGSDNPFGNFCSTIMGKYKLESNTGLFGIIGPMRMNYEKNLGLVKFINQILTNN
jgi:heat-inducible transcriptional repressor